MNPISDEEIILREEDIDEIIDMEDIEKVNSSSEDENDTFSGHNIIMNNDLPRDDAVRVYCPYKPEENVNKHSIFSCSLSKNGELAAIGDENDGAYVWNTITGETVIDCTLDHKDSVIFTEFNYNDKYVATGDMSGVIQLWRISDKSCIWSINLDDDIKWIKWHHSANVLLVSIASGEVHILKVGNTEAHKVFPKRCGNDVPLTGVILADGKRAALGYSNGAICVIDLKTNNVLSTISDDPTGLHGHSDMIIALDCHIDNNLLISVSQDGKTILSTAHNGKIISILQDLNCNNKTEINEANDSDSECNFSLEVAAFCKDPTFSVAATGVIDFVGDHDCNKGRIFIWDVSRQILRHEIKQEAGVIRLVWTNTSIFFTAGIDGILRSFDAKAGCHLRTFLGHMKTILDLHISCEAKKILTSSDDGTARIFDISSLI